MHITAAKHVLDNLGTCDICILNRDSARMKALPSGRIYGEWARYAVQK